VTTLPQKLNLRETMHGHGGKGMAFYRYADREHGVHLEARRATSRERFVESFSWDFLPGYTFPSYGALCLAAKGVTEEDIATEKARYPYVRSAKPVGERKYSNSCRLCDKPGFLLVLLAHNWQPCGDSYAELCEDHQQLAQDPRALNEALEAEAATRRARAEAKGLLRLAGEEGSDA
jgi:hypothetical protein